MKNSLKTLAIVFSAPVFLTFCFATNVIKSEVTRAPAVEQMKMKTVKAAVKEYLLAVNNVK